MKYIPILYSTPMVQALLKDIKLMTRRTKGLDFINKNSNLFRYDSCDDSYGDYDRREPDATLHWFENIDENGKELEKYVSVKCPYGKVGDVLWVRETFVKVITIYGGEAFIYKADDNCYKDTIEDWQGWKPSLFMPKAACRIFLEITDIRVERLKDISYEDASKEGVKCVNVHVIVLYKDYFDKNNTRGFEGENNTIKSFESLWQSINGKESWDKNPFVWVISFKRIEKPTDFC